MLSTTSSGAPASTSSPACSGVATTSAGTGERTMPPSSRLIRCVMPSTSTRWIGPCVLVMTLKRTPFTVIWPLCSSKRSMSTSAACSGPPAEMPMRNRWPPVRATWTR